MGRAANNLGGRLDGVLGVKLGTRVFCGPNSGDLGLLNQEALW